MKEDDRALRQLSSFRSSGGGGSGAPVHLMFEDVTVTLPPSRYPSPTPGKVLIDGVSGHATSGRVLALMGPSGARVFTAVLLLQLQTARWE